MKFYEKHKALRDKFEIIAFHDASVKNFEELDTKLAKIKKERWGGKDLPFPVLLDSTRKTIRDWGISYYPTIVLIDPEGNLVKGGNERLLEKKLMEASREKK